MPKNIAAGIAGVLIAILLVVAAWLGTMCRRTAGGTTA